MVKYWRKLWIKWINDTWTLKSAFQKDYRYKKKYIPFNGAVVLVTNLAGQFRSVIVNRIGIESQSKAYMSSPLNSTLK